MQCADVRPLLELLHDGILEPKDTSLVVDHLRTCAPCDSEWKSLEQLRERFKAAGATPEMPEGLMDKISASLTAEDKKDRKVFAFPKMAAAAAIVIVGYVANKYFPSQDITAQSPTHAEELVAGLSAASLAPEQDKQILAQKVGYALKQLNLPQWRMADFGVSRLAADAHLARFDFVNDATGEKLSCYQGKKGTIAAAGVREKLADKDVLLGERGGFRYALWSQNDRDYLFVTQLPADRLKALVAGV